MAEFDTSYRTPRHRPGMDPNTRKLAIIAGGIGAALVVMVGAWSLTGGKSGGVPVVEADSRPLRVKPDSAQQGPEIDTPTAPGQQALAPKPEAPKPEALRAAAERAAAERAAAEKAAADRLAAERAAAEQRTQAAAAPPAAAPAPAPAPAASARAPAPAPVQPVVSAPAARPAPQPAVLSSPAPQQAAVPAPPARTPAAPAQAQASSGGTQVQLAAVTSEQAALNEWNRLERRMPEVLGGRRPAVVKTERDGKTFYRLRTGGFADASQARSFCERVRAGGGVCSVATF
jgi:FtsZ-interacting cell division protein ZipA